MSYFLRFSIRHFIAFCISFVLCVLIVIYTRELGVLRGWIGDIIIIVLLYSIVETITHIPIMPLVLVIVSIATGVEILQYFQFAKYMGWEVNSLSGIIFGSVFDIMDIFAYIIGGIFSIILDRFLTKQGNETNNSIII